VPCNVVLDETWARAKKHKTETAVEKMAPFRLYTTDKLMLITAYIYAIFLRCKVSRGLNC